MQPKPDIDLYKLVDEVFDTNPEFDEKPRPHQVFFLVWSLVGQVDNGGFDQFYFNSSGDYARETISALKEIGAEQVADIVIRGNALFGAVGPIKDFWLRRSQMDNLEDSVDDEFDSLDSKFAQYSNDFDSLLKKYVVAHADEFGLD